MSMTAARLLIFMLGLICVAGCGSSNVDKISPSSDATPAAPAAAPTVAAAPTAPAQKTEPAPAAAKPKPAGKPADKKSAVPENANPKTVFAVSQIGTPMDVISADGVIPSFQYEVALAEPGNNSTKYAVESIGDSAQSQSLIGRGTPKAGFTLPKGFTEFKPTGYDASGLPLRIVCTKTGTQLALVPGGTSIVGTDHGPDEFQPSYSVSLDPFYMEILEVTVQDYEKYRSELREKKKPSPPSPSNPNANPDFPVLGVSWAGAQGYVRWAGMELPTEAEFEKAARGPKGLRTPWGDGKPLWGARGISQTGAYQEDRSPYGILDLAGNAKEWCTDLFSPTANSEAAAAAVKEILRNWSGPKKVREMNLRVVKGNAPDWSAWYREGLDMQKVHSDVGFRGVLRLTTETKESKPGSKKGSGDSKKTDQGF